MQNFIKTIISAVQTWAKGKIKDSTADWNQNDPNADNYIKNRTHYTEMGKDVTILKDFVAVEGQNAININHVFEIGAKYTVKTPMGIYYSVPVKNWEDEYNGIGAVWGDYSDLPFGFTSQSVDRDGSDFELYAPIAGTYTLIKEADEVIHKLDPKYIELPTNLATTDDVQVAIDTAEEAYQIADNIVTSKMDATNPAGTGSFSMNRKAGTTVGDYSHAEGYNATAEGTASHAEGTNTVAGYNYSHAEGQGTKTQGRSMHVCGEYNLYDGWASLSSYRHGLVCVVGNGTSNTKRSNAYTLDWNGLGWFAGGLKVGGASQYDEAAVEVALKTDIPAEFTVIKPFPNNVVGKWNTPGTDVLKLEDKTLYMWDSAAAGNSAAAFFAVADDGTMKNITTISSNELYYVAVSASYITITGNNTTYKIYLTDKTTANNIVVEYSYNQKYVDSTNTREYTPTGDYNPATKKYVDDSVSATVKTVNGVAPDANGNVVIEVSGGETVTDEHINELIDAKLAAIPNAAEVAY